MWAEPDQKSYSSRVSISLHAFEGYTSQKSSAKYVPLQKTLPSAVNNEGRMRTNKLYLVKAVRKKVLICCVKSYTVDVVMVSKSNFVGLRSIHSKCCDKIVPVHVDRKWASGLGVSTATEGAAIFSTEEIHLESFNAQELEDGCVRATIFLREINTKMKCSECLRLWSYLRSVSRQNHLWRVVSTRFCITWGVLISCKMAVGCLVLSVFSGLRTNHILSGTA